MVISSMMLVDVAECYPLVSLRVYPFQERRKDSSRRGRRAAASTAPRLPVRRTANARNESGPKSVPMLIVLFMLLLLPETVAVLGFCCVHQKMVGFLPRFLWISDSETWRDIKYNTSCERVKKIMNIFYIVTK
jgi:hypothetical protein